MGAKPAAAHRTYDDFVFLISRGENRVVGKVSRSVGRPRTVAKRRHANFVSRPRPGNQSKQSATNKGREERLDITKRFVFSSTNSPTKQRRFPLLSRVSSRSVTDDTDDGNHFGLDFLRACTSLLRLQLYNIDRHASTHVSRIYRTIFDRFIVRYFEIRRNFSLSLSLSKK